MRTNMAIKACMYALIPAFVVFSDGSIETRLLDTAKQEYQVTCSAQGLYLHHVISGVSEKSGVEEFIFVSGRLVPLDYLEYCFVKGE